jgi:propionate CoA-transferase
VIVNYDHFTINPEVLDEYSAMIDDLVRRFCSGVTRYATSSFLRAKLGQRSLAPYIFESAEEARAHLRQLESQVTGWSARKRCPDE